MVHGKLIDSVTLGVALLTVSAVAVPSSNVTTHHYDNLRTGWNSDETLLTPTAVAGGSFTLQHQVSLDQQVDAQPLLVTNQTIAGGAHDVAYVATENNTVYAVDAASGVVLLSRNLGTPVPMSALPGGCSNNSTVVGIGGTPVIDSAAGILYLITYTFESSQPVYRLHALNIDTLQDTVPSRVISATAVLTNGQGYEFTPGSSRQRAALLLANGNVYAAFGSFCDLSANTSRGWVLGWQTGTLTPLADSKLTDTLATTPDHFFLTAIWMSGSGLAASAAGDIYFVTGNTDPNGKENNHITNISESVAQLSDDLSTLKSIFTPGGATDGHAILDERDEDFGAGGVMLLPPQSGASSNLAVAAGKAGIMYLLNADNLRNGATTVIGNAVSQVKIGGCWCAESYYTGADGFGRVVSSGGSNVIVWKVEAGSKVPLVKLATSSTVANVQSPGFFTTVSSDGTASGTAVIWAVGRPASSKPADINLYAFNESGQQLFTAVAGAWPNYSGNSNIVPVVANGHVYVATYQQLSIYGLGSGTAAPSSGSIAPTKLTNSIAAALPVGQHEIFGTVQSIDGSTIMVVTRGGDLIRVDAESAFANFLAAQPAVGHGILIRGIIDESGVVHAETLLHAKDNPLMWQPDQ